MNLSSDALRKLSTTAAYVPKEQLQAVETHETHIYIGIPRETSFQEKRVALTPDAVALLSAHGHRVVIEKGAGDGSNFSDNAYRQAGAEVESDVKEVYKANIIMKVAPPSEKEVEMLQERQTLISALQLSVQPRNFLQKLMAKHITAIAWDFIQDEVGIFPIVRAMGEIAGNTSILVAAELLSQSAGSRRVMFGGISGVQPTEVVVIGAGTVGEFATRAAIGLGASVKVFDKSTHRLRRIQNDIGMRLNTCVLHPDKLAEALSRCDVAIGAVRAENGRTPCIVTEEMVNRMKYGSVIVDVSIDQGGCFETSEVTTHEHPTCVKYGVIHYCVPNIASRVSGTASEALSNIFSPILLKFGEQASLINVLRNYSGVRNGVYLYNGTLTHKALSTAYDLPYKDLNLLLAMF
ncbi:MAG: alanine dehydrogenase [Flavobacteriales bacterium]|jgi:alanine dehydrogenase|nr:alanine dehydrogenase [Flavobacteriales bacterium]